MITPLHRVGAGEDQENVMFLALRWVTVKLWGGPVGTREEQRVVFVIMVMLLSVAR